MSYNMYLKKNSEISIKFYLVYHVKFLITLLSKSLTSLLLKISPKI